jgi:hypothetical protein
MIIRNRKNINEQIIILSNILLVIW